MPLRRIASSVSIENLNECIVFATPISAIIKEEGNMKFIITITRDEDGMYIAECPAIPGCVSQGKTEKEAQRNIQDAIKECIEVRAEKGMPLTIATKQIEVPV
jgi:predicted RNase H-like HicB family nuclease